MDISQPERRQFPRIKFTGKVQFRKACLENGAVISIIATATNLSEKGMMVQIAQRLKFGSVLKLCFQLPNVLKQKIETEAKVVWSTPSEKEGLYNVGLQFVEIENLKQTFIRTFIYGRMHSNDGFEQK